MCASQGNREGGGGEESCFSYERKQGERSISTIDKKERDSYPYLSAGGVRGKRGGDLMYTDDCFGIQASPSWLGEGASRSLVIFSLRNGEESVSGGKGGEERDGLLSDLPLYAGERREGEENRAGTPFRKKGRKKRKRRRKMKD